MYSVPFFMPQAVGDDIDMAITLQSLPALTAQFRVVTGECIFDDPDVYAMETSITPVFSLEARADGYYLNPQSLDYPTRVYTASDCIAPPHQTVQVYDTTDLSGWGWRLTSPREGYGESRLADYLTLGTIDPQTGRLEGLDTNLPQGTTVYIVHSMPIRLYEVLYYDLQGEPIDYSDYTFALPGSDLTKPPIDAISAGLPADMTAYSFALLDTDTPPPSPPTGPLRLQVIPATTKTHTVTFMDGEKIHGTVQTVESGGTIDWALVGAPSTEPRVLFTGWALPGETVPVNPLLPITDNLTLHALYAPAHAITFYARTGDDTPLLTLYAANGATIPAQDFPVPSANQPFLGWVTAAGTAFTAKTPVSADLSVYGQYETLALQAELYLTERCFADANDNTNGYGDTPYLLATSAIWYDAADDLYYFDPSVLSLPTIRDTLGNTFPVELATLHWTWQYGTDGTTYPLTETEKGWSLGRAFQHASLTGDTLVLTYAQPLTYHALYLHDEDGALLNCYRVLDGASLAALQSDLGAQSLLPQALKAAYDRWTALDEGRSPLPGQATAPLHVAVKYKPRYTVTWYANDSMDADFATLTVIEGQTIDWTQIATPQQERARFFAWQQVGYTEDGLQKLPFDPETPITSSIFLLAQFKNEYTIDILDGYGRVAGSVLVLEGDTLQLDSLASPQKDRLDFAYWTDASGRRLEGGLIAEQDQSLVPVFEATLRFMHGEELLETRTVLEGERMTALPDGPDVPFGYAFLSWDAAATSPITHSQEIQACLGAEVTFYYGLMGEKSKKIIVPVGSKASLPAAGINGYLYQWDTDLLKQPITGPITVFALYAAIDAGIPEDPPVGDPGDIYAEFPYEGYPVDTSWSGPWYTAYSQPVDPFEVLFAYAPHPDGMPIYRSGGHYQILDDDIPLAWILSGTGGDCME